MKGLRSIIKTVIELHGGGNVSEFLAPLGAVVIGFTWFSTAGITTILTEIISGNIGLATTVGAIVGIGGIFASLLLFFLCTVDVVKLND